MSIDIEVEPTPNPYALKFILKSFVKNGDKVSFAEPEEGEDVPLVQKLFDISGVDNLYFFQNVITVTIKFFASWDELEDKVLEVIDANLPFHDPDFQKKDPEIERRMALSPEVQKIEEILDVTVRPALQADGGDIQCLELMNKNLLVKFQGACGSCPSSEAGTLNAIKSILRDEYDPEIDVFVVPED